MPTVTEQTLIKQILARSAGQPTLQTALPSSTPPDLRAAATETAQRYGLDPSLFDSLVSNESGYDPSALSDKGAIGLTQLMPDTAAELGVDPHDPIQNLDGGARYFRHLMDRYKGSAELALAAYNAGPAHVDQYGGVPPFKETQDYVRRVIGGRRQGPRPVSSPIPAPPPAPAEGLDPITQRMLLRLGPPPPPPPPEPSPYEQRELTPAEAGAVTPEPPQPAAPAGPRGIPARPGPAFPSEIPSFESPQPEQPPAAIVDQPGPPTMPGGYFAGGTPEAEATGHGLQQPSVGDKLRSAGYSFAKSLVELPTGLLNSIAIGAKEIDALFGNKKELDQYATRYIAKKIEDIANEYFPDDKILHDDFLASTLPSFLGIGAGFVLGGAAGRAVGAARAVPGLLGAGMFGAQGYEQAKAAGAPEDRALVSMLANAGLGVVEVGWVTRMLNRLDADTGGVFKRALIESGKTSIDAAVNVAVQTVGSNAVAKWLYDNQREMLQGLGPAAAGGGLSAGIIAFLTNMLAGAFHARTVALAKPAEAVARQDKIEQESKGEEPPLPGVVTEGTTGEIPLPERPPLGPMPDEQRLPPIEPSGRWTSEAIEEARQYIPWISEGEIQSSSDLPALIEVAKNRLQAYKEKVLTDQATDEERRMLNTPGAPRLLLLRLIEDRLAQRPPGREPEPPPPEPPPEMGPKAIPEGAPEPPPSEGVPVVTEEEYQQSLGVLRKFLAAPPEGPAPAPPETPAPVPPEPPRPAPPPPRPAARDIATMTDAELAGEVSRISEIFKSREFTAREQLAASRLLEEIRAEILRRQEEAAKPPVEEPLAPKPEEPPPREPSVPKLSEADQAKAEWMERTAREYLEAGSEGHVFKKLIDEGGVGYDHLKEAFGGKDIPLAILRSGLNAAFRRKLIVKGKGEAGLDVLAEILERDGYLDLSGFANKGDALAHWLHDAYQRRLRLQSKLEKEWERLTQGLPEEGPPSGEVPKAEFGKADPDLEGLATKAAASDFKAGEVFTATDGHQYTVTDASDAGLTLQREDGLTLEVPPGQEIGFVDRFTPGGKGPQQYAGMAVSEPPKAPEPKPDPFAAAPPEVRQALLKTGIYLFNRGQRSVEAFREALIKDLGPGVEPFVKGAYDKLSKLPAFAGPVPAPAPPAKGVEGGQREPGKPAGPTLPAGEKPRRGRGVAKVPEPAGPGKPVEGPAKAPPERPQKPSPPKAPPVFTREIREGGVATLGRELLPKVSQNEIDKHFPKATVDAIATKVGKRPMPHQVETVTRFLRAVGFDLVGNEIPDARKQNVYHAYLMGDGTGTGKTYSAGLAIYKFFERDPKTPVLVVVKNETLFRQWVSDVLEPLGFKANYVTRESPLTKGENLVNFITNSRVEIAAREKMLGEIERFGPGLLIVDECQAMKNLIPDTADRKGGGVRTALALERMTRFSKNTLFMSATPFESVLHTGYLSMMKLWYPQGDWRQWIQKSLGISFKDGVWSGLSPQKLAKFFRILVEQGRMMKSEIDFKNLKNSKGDKITLTTENIKVPLTEDQQAEYDRIGGIFGGLLEDESIKTNRYKRRLVLSIQYHVKRSLDEMNKLPRAVELGRQAREAGKTVVFTLFRKNDTDMAEWWNRIITGKKTYGPKSFMPELVRYLSSQGISIVSPTKYLHEAFPDFVRITGDEPAGGAVRTGNIEKLMKGEAPGAILTMAAGGTGLSAHDTIGKFPRVQINISAPDTAGTMVQVAGRTFRLGSESSTHMYWLFGDTPSEATLAAKIAWRLKEMGALVMGQERNPTAEEIEAFDFPEDPARTAEESLAGFAAKFKDEPLLPGIEFGKKSTKQQLEELALKKRKARATGEEAPGGPLFDLAEEQDFQKKQGKLPSMKPEAPAIFIGRMGGRADAEQWHPTEDIPGIEPGSTVSRQTLEKLGYHVPEAPPEPAGIERGSLPLEMERQARELLKTGKATDIYDARRQVMTGQTTGMAPRPELEIETKGPLTERRKAERTWGVLYDREITPEGHVEFAKKYQERQPGMTFERAMTESAILYPRHVWEQARQRTLETVQGVGGTEKEALSFTGEEVRQLARLSGTARADYAHEIVNRMRAENAKASEGAGLLPPRRAEDNAADYGFLPHLHREPNPQGTVVEGLKSNREIINDLTRLLNTRQAIGWFRPKKGVLAHFEIWRNLIRGKVYHDVEVMAHEGGHRLDQLFFPIHPGLGLGSATAPELAAYKAELLKIATEARPGQSRIPEGFAEFVRFYLTNEQQARKVAPKFYRYFDETLKKNLPDVYTGFQGIRADWENMMNADPVAAIKMTIASGAVKGSRIPQKYYPSQLYESIVDELAIVRNARDHLFKLVQKWGDKHELPEATDPKILASTYVAWPDWVEQWVKHGQYDWMEPSKKIGRSLLQIFKPVGDRLMDYEAFAKSVDAIHDLETKGWDPWEKYGIYESWARETIKRHSNEFMPVYKEMVGFYSNIVDSWVKAELMTPELAKKMRSKQGVYSPMWRVFIDRAIEDFEHPGMPGKRFTNLPQVTMMRHGSRIETIPSVEAAMKMLMVTFKRAEENAIPLWLTRLAERTPGGGKDVAAVVLEGQRPVVPIYVTAKEVLDKLGIPKEALQDLDEELLLQAVPIFRPSPFKPRGPYQDVWMGGKRVVVEFDPEIYKAMNFLGRHDMGVLDKMLAPFVSALRAGAIVLSPSFHLRSFIKDPWTALIQSSNPVLHAAYFVPSLTSALFHGEAYQRYKRAMGGVSTFLGMQPEDIGSYMQTLTQKQYGGAKYWANPRNWARELFGAMSYLGLALEYTPRIAEARVHGLMTAKTRSEFLRAGYAGRNATIDFNMMGGLTRSLTRSAAFFGVGVSGIGRMAREIKTRPLATAIKFSIIAGLPTFYYYMAMKDDERWKRLPQRERDSHFIFWLPGMQEPIRIPKPYEWGAAMTLFERSLEYHDKRDPMVLGQVARNVATGLPNPVPTGLMLGWELAANYSQYLGRPISPTRGEPGEQYWNYTTQTARGIGRLLGVSSAKVEYGLKQVTGGLYSRIVPGLEEQTGLAKPTATLPSAAESPVFGGLIRRYPGQATEQMNRFYENYWVPASQVYESFTTKRKQEPEDLKRYLAKKSQYLAIYYGLRGIEGTLSNLRDARDLVAQSNLPEDEKRKRLIKINEALDRISASGNKVAQRILGGNPQPPAGQQVGAPP